MKQRCLLVVDDETVFTRLVRLNLPEYHVVEVNDARQALETARAVQPDMIFLDVVMPGLDGGDIASQIRSDPALQDVPIIFLTAIVSRSEMRPGRQIGGFPFLAKPVLPQELRRCIHAHLNASMPSV